MDRTPPVLYDWPSAAAVGSVVPKSRFYEAAKLKPATRERFVQDVQRITWAYKLAETTIHLAGTSDLQEIQVFEVEAKGEDVSEDVLAAIAKAVRSSVVFEVIRASGERHTAVCLGQAGCFTTGWAEGSAVRSPMPTSIDLEALYLALAGGVLPLVPRVGERKSAFVDRLRHMRTLQREISALERRLRSEPQLNRKFDLRRTILTRQAELSDLMSATTPSTAIMGKY